MCLRLRFELTDEARTELYLRLRYELTDEARTEMC
jgi:hypothetical protein